MKHAKKLASILMALAMALCLAIPAFAADHAAEGPDAFGDGTANGNGTITINDAVARETYDLYQILYLESYSKTVVNDKEVTHYAYKANSSWNTFLNSAGIKDTYVKFDNDYVSWVDGADAAEFAKKALEYAQTDAAGKKPGEAGYNEATATIKPIKTATATSTTVAFDGLKLGYYLIDTTLGSLCSLDTTDPSVVMQEKNEVPQNVKQVKEDSDGYWKGNTQTPGSNHADIGQQVEFRSTITVYPGTDNLIFHDKMDPGLSFTQADANNITVTIKNQAADEGTPLTKDVDYTVEFDPDGTVSHVSADIEGDCTFHIKFNDSVFANFSTSSTKTIVISYTATLNENAVVGVPGNVNTSQVSYGDDFHATPGSTTKTRTFEFPVFKFDKETNEPLSDTKFELHANNAQDQPGNLIYLVKEADQGDNGEDIYHVAKAGDPGAATEITTNNTGKFIIRGLDAGTYHLVETAPKEGYNKLKNPVVVNITYTPGENEGDGTVAIKQDNKDVTAVGVEIENGSGTELPTTGGIGTTLFYVFGGLLAAGAVILLVTKRRMDSQN